MGDFPLSFVLQGEFEGVQMLHLEEPKAQSAEEERKGKVNMGDQMREQERANELNLPKKAPSTLAAFPATVPQFAGIRAC